MKFLEEAYLADVVDAGLPLPRTQTRFHPVRRWKVDFYWPDVNLVVEIEGGTGWHAPEVSHHTSPDGYRNDCEKYNALMQRGIEMGRPITLLRFTGAMVRDRTARDTTVVTYNAIREAECRRKSTKALS